MSMEIKDMFVIPDISPFKLCTHCNETQPVDNFRMHKKDKNRIGRRAMCRKCQDSKRKNMAEYLRGYFKKYNSDPANAEKIRARKITYKAIREGKLIKKTNCEECGSDKNVEMHHIDYSKPLHIVFLCKKHHIVADGKLKFT